MIAHIEWAILVRAIRAFERTSGSESLTQIEQIIHAFFMKSKRSNPDDPRESIAFCLAKIASRPPCFLAFVLFLLLELAEGVERLFDLACGRVEFPDRDEVFDASIVLDECFLCEREIDLSFGTDDGEMLIRVFLPQDSHL